MYCLERKLDKMRLVIVDLHCNGFLLCNFEHLIDKRWPLTKHRFFLEAALESGYEVLNFVTGSQSQLWIGKSVGILNKLEADYVLRRNGLKGKVQNIYRASDIRDDDIVVFYSHEDSGFDLTHTPGRKFCNVNHFFSMQSVYNIPLYDFLNPDAFDGYICESDVLNDSLFFRKYLPIEDKKMILLPYVAEERFEKNNNFNNRKNKALALGSCGIENELFQDVYGTKDLHPMRNCIWNNRDNNIEQVDCMIEKIEHEELPYKIKENENIVVRFLKRAYNHFSSTRNSVFRKNGKNAGYYNRDMVKLLNEYKMFIYPEDVTGVPALGFVEGMNCGCAYIGLDSTMYTKLGMIPGVHYIAYDGTYDNLIEKIKYFQSHTEELETIAENGYKFVKENFTKENVFNNFIRQLNGETNY